MDRQCPKCQSYKIRSSKRVAVSILLLGLGLGFLIVPLIFVPVGVVMLFMPSTYQCEGCGYKFK